MNVKDCHENYYFNTGKVSEIIRQLGLAGIAVVWLFKTDVGDAIVLPRPVVWAAILVLVGLLVDLTQYIAGSLCWGLWGRCQDKEGAPEEFRAPGWINKPAIVCLILKVPLILGAYILLLRHLFSRLVY